MCIGHFSVSFGRKEGREAGQTGKKRSLNKNPDNRVHEKKHFNYKNIQFQLCSRNNGTNPSYNSCFHNSYPIQKSFTVHSPFSPAACVLRICAHCMQSVAEGKLGVAEKQTGVSVNLFLISDGWSLFYFLLP